MCDLLTIYVNLATCISILSAWIKQKTERKCVSFFPFMGVRIRAELMNNDEDEYLLFWVMLLLPMLLLT